MTTLHFVSCTLVFKCGLLLVTGNSTAFVEVFMQLMPKEILFPVRGDQRNTLSKTIVRLIGHFRVTKLSLSKRG